MCLPPPQLTAIEIAALKQLNRGQTLYILDTDGSTTARPVARQLTKRGFGKTFVIAGGAVNWANSRLRIKPFRQGLLPAATTTSDSQAEDAADAARILEELETVQTELSRVRPPAGEADTGR